MKGVKRNVPVGVKRGFPGRTDTPPDVGQDVTDPGATEYCKAWIALFFLFAGFFLPSCSGMFGRTPETGLETRDEAERILSGILQTNETLGTFKGIGRIAITQDATQQKARIAWIGTRYGQLRLEILSPFGQPVASLASDADWLYVNLYERRRYQKIKTSNPSLKTFISIPISTGDVVQLLMGRVPIKAWHHAIRINEDPWDGTVLVLKTRWGHVLEKIFLETDLKTVRRVEMYNRSTSLLYRIVIEDTQDIDGYTVPKTLRMEAHKGTGAVVSLERYWTNVEVSPSVFQLQPPPRHSVDRSGKNTAETP